MLNESAIVHDSNIDHSFSFQQNCSTAFLEYLQNGVIAVQVRAYEKNRMKDHELRDLRKRLRRAEGDLTKLRGDVGKDCATGAVLGGIGGAVVGACVAGPVGAAAGGVVGAAGGATVQNFSKEEKLKVDLAHTKEEAAQTRRDLEINKRELELAQKQLSTLQHKYEQQQQQQPHLTGIIPGTVSQPVSHPDSPVNHTTELNTLNSRVRELELQLKDAQESQAASTQKTSVCDIM